MFDLFRSREKAVRYVLGGLLTLVAVSMVTYLVPTFNSGLSSSESPLIADVAGQKITALQAQQIFQRVTRGTQIPPEMMDVYLPQFVEQMILQRAAVYEANRLGLTVNDDEVLTGMISATPQFFPNGVLASKEQLEQYYAEQGQSLPEAIEDMRSQLVLRKLQNSLLETTVVSPQEVEKEFKRKYDKAKIQYIAFPPAKFRDQVKVADEDIRKEFDRTKALYTIPDKYTYQVVVIDQAKVEASISVTDAQLRQAYSASMDNFRLPERVHARHILVKTEGKSDAEKKPLMAKAEDLLKQLKGGADFAELAKKASEDPGSGQKGGDLDWLVRGQTVPEFEKAAFALKTNELSGIVTTQFGYHIIQSMGHEQARVQSLDEVRANLATQIRQQSVNEKMQSLADQAHATLQKMPETAAEVAKQLGVDAIKMDKAEVNAAIPTLGVTPEIGGILPSMKNLQVSDVLVLPANRMALVVLENKIASKPSEFDEVKDKVRDKMITDRAALVADGKAKEAADRLKKGEDLAQVARAYGVEVTTSSDFGVNDSVEGLGAAVYVDQAFSQPIGSILGPSVIQGRNVVSKVVAKTDANMSAFAAEKDTLTADLKRKRATERNDLMLDSILTKLVSEGKVRVYQAEIQKLVASYRQNR